MTKKHGFLRDEIEPCEIESIDDVNNAYLPVTLGYVFVALSVPSLPVFFTVFLVISVLVFKSTTSFFDPLFLLKGYNFYHITKNNGVKILLVIKGRISKKSDLTSTLFVNRLNDTVFIERKVSDVDNNS